MLNSKIKSDFVWYYLIVRYMDFNINKQLKQCAGG